MKRIRIFLLLLCAACLHGLPARAGLRDDVLSLSDSIMEGRGFGSRGAVEASAYIMRRLRGIGLEPIVQGFPGHGSVGHNVLAVCRGDRRSERYTLVCARYDGLGKIDGTVYPGADANASGVAVLLYLAEALKDSGRNFIFAALDGHSDGMSGAEALAGGPWKLGLVVNLDTIGSTLAPPNKYRPDYLIALGGKKWEKLLETCNAGTGLRLYYDYYRSKSFTDYFYSKISSQAPFLRRGVPAVMFTSGITMNTNKSSDTPDSLDYEVLQRRAELIRIFLSKL